MGKNDQVDVTLDRYHRFVVERFKEVLGTSRSDVVGQFVRAWVSDHADQVQQAGASMTDFRQQLESEVDRG